MLHHPASALAIALFAGVVILAAGLTPATAQPVVDTGIAAFKSGDYKKALDTLEWSALNGHAEAQYLMGQMREHGLGISSDSKRALYWYGRAAAQGQVGARAAQEAMRAIDRPAIAPKPLTGAALRPSAPDQPGRPAVAATDAGRLQAMLEGRQPYAPARALQSVEVLKPRAENGDADLAALLGQFYESTLPGTPDYAAAARWYGKAVELKHPLATNNLGALYYDGRGVQQDFARAQELYRAAAEAGYAVAQYNLGLMQGQGRGVAVNVPQMVEWIKKAAAQNYPRAQAQLARLYLEGVGVEHNSLEAANLFRAAAEGGNANAQYWYGRLLTTGNGVARNLAIGADWIFNAAEAGVPVAMHEAGTILEIGLGRVSNNQRALAWYRKAGEAGVKAAAARLALAYANGELGVRLNAQEAARWSALAR